MFSLFQINVLRNRVSDHQKTWETNSQSHFFSLWRLSNRLNRVKGLGLKDKKEKTETDKKRIVTTDGAEIQISWLLVPSMSQAQHMMWLDSIFLLCLVNGHVCNTGFLLKNVVVSKPKPISSDFGKLPLVPQKTLYKCSLSVRYFTSLSLTLAGPFPAI